MKSKLITKAGLLRWACTQRADKVWDFYDNLNCPLACYLQSLGYTGVTVGGWTWSSKETSLTDIPKAIRAALGKASDMSPACESSCPITQPNLVIACR